MAEGMYKMGVEASPHKQQIDTWLNEGKALTWISNELKGMGGYLSTNALSKYKRARDERIQKELEKTPEFKAKQQMVTEQFNDSVAKIQKVDLIGRLSELIEDSAELLEDAKMRGIQINNVKDMRMVQQTMLDAINAYGDTMLKAQQFEEINNDPSLLKKQSTTININVKSALTDILRTAMEEGGDGYGIIDKLRAGVTGTVIDASIVDVDGE